jgi:hypothetical protein
MYTLIVKMIKSDHIKNQRSGVVLNPPFAKFPKFINWHKNYAKACGLETNKLYVITVKEETNDAGYDTYTVKQKLELGEMS